MATIPVSGTGSADLATHRPAATPRRAQPAAKKKNGRQYSRWRGSAPHSRRCGHKQRCGRGALRTGPQRHCQSVVANADIDATRSSHLSTRTPHSSIRDAWRAIRASISSARPAIAQSHPRGQERPDAPDRPANPGINGHANHSALIRTHSRRSQIVISAKIVRK